MLKLSNKKKVLDLIARLSHEVINIVESPYTPKFAWENDETLVNSTVDRVDLGLLIITNKNTNSIRKTSDSIQVQIKVLEVLSVYSNKTLLACNGINIGISYSTELSDLVVTAADFDEELDVPLLDSEFEFVSLKNLKSNLIEKSLNTELNKSNIF